MCWTVDKLDVGGGGGVLSQMTLIFLLRMTRLFQALIIMTRVASHLARSDTPNIT